MKKFDQGIIRGLSVTTNQRHCPESKRQQRKTSRVTRFLLYYSGIVSGLFSLRETLPRTYSPYIPVSSIFPSEQFPGDFPPQLYRGQVGRCESISGRVLVNVVIRKCTPLFKYIAKNSISPIQFPFRQHSFYLFRPDYSASYSC